MMILQSKSHILARYNFAMHDAMALRLRRRLFKINYLSYLNKNRATIGCPKLGIYLLPTRFRDRFLTPCTEIKSDGQFYVKIDFEAARTSTRTSNREKPQLKSILT